VRDGFETSSREVAHPVVPIHAKIMSELAM
jgi:hypothetical protein